jgi:hypothetical protein
MAYYCFKRGEKTGLALLNLPTLLCGIWNLKWLKRQKLREAMRANEADGCVRWEADSYLPTPIIPSSSHESKLSRKDVLLRNPIKRNLLRFKNRCAK